MIWRISALFLILTASVSSSLAQTYEVECSRMPLNELLVQLRQQYNFQLSFDDGLLSTYSVTLTGSYPSAEEVIEALLTEVPLSYEKINGVFVIFPVEGDLLSREFLLSGQILESGSGEPLPYSHLLINDFASVSDLKGSFSYASSTDSFFHVKASHLGCYILDTTLQAGQIHKLFLKPFTYGLQEVVVRDTRVERSVQLGESAGLITLNSYIAQYLPGNGDNSVFNLLRLQPGILAAGEQPNDLIIQGSPEGTSRVLLDGITIWGLKNFSDNISAVNPFLAKNIQVYKSGYDVTHGDLVGGMVDITGRVGSTRRAGLNLFLNNQTLNGMIELPILKKASLVLAFRKTYYNLLDKSDFPGLNSEDLEYEVVIKPDYLFRDLNAKFSVQGDNGDLFFLSLFGGEDRFSYEVNQNRDRTIFAQTSRETNRQGGASLFYGKNWTSGARTQFSVVSSVLQNEVDIHRTLENKQFGAIYDWRKDNMNTDVNELTLKTTHYLPSGKRHEVELGLEAVYDEVWFREDTFEVAKVDEREQGWRLNLFLQDNISLGQALRLKPGLRMNHQPQSGISWLDPRLDVRLNWGGLWKFNASWGNYHQFLVKSSVVDDSGNYRYTWSLANNESVPVLSATHWVVGATFGLHDFTASVEGYYKDTRGMTRYVRSQGQQEAVFSGKGRSYGLDFFVKKDFKRHSFWASYTLGRAEELFPYFPENGYRRAPQDQRHELKLTGLVNLGAFHFSGAWVYGTGFPLYNSYLGRTYSEPDYRRLDLSLVYRFPIQKFSGEAGLSVMNVLDADNVKYASFERIPVDQLNTIFINVDSMPFTPLVFLKMTF